MKITKSLRNAAVTCFEERGMTDEQISGFFLSKRSIYLSADEVRDLRRGKLKLSKPSRKRKVKKKIEGLKWLNT